MILIDFYIVELYNLSGILCGEVFVYFTKTALKPLQIHICYYLYKNKCVVKLHILSVKMLIQNCINILNNILI